MSLSEIITCVYTKNKKIQFLNEEWLPLYLNKCFIQDKDCSEIINRIIEYCFYVSPTHYFYLLYILIPKKFNYNFQYPKKASKDDTEDELVNKLKQFLGWSEKEYQLNKAQIEKEILSNREYWESELGVDNVKRRKK